MIKMSDGSNVMAEVEYNDVNYSYTLTSPLLIGNTVSQGGEVTTSLPYLPGMKGDTLVIPSTFIVTMSEVDQFFRQFYGASLLKFYMQNIMRQLSANGTTEIDSDGVNALKLKQEEIESKYGSIANLNDKIIPTERVLH